VGVGKGRRDEELIGVRGSFIRCVRINSKCDNINSPDVIAL